MPWEGSGGEWLQKYPEENPKFSGVVFKSSKRPNKWYWKLTEGGNLLAYGYADSLTEAQRVADSKALMLLSKQNVENGIIGGINATQRVILIIGFAVICLMGIYPPWEITYIQVKPKYEEGIFGRGESLGVAPIRTVYYEGHHFILKPPHPSPNPEYREGTAVDIDLPRLLVQWVIVASAVIVGVLIAGFPW